MSADKPPVTALLTDPDEFFRARSEEPSIVGPLIVVTLVAIVGSLAAFVENETLVSTIRPLIESAIENSSENTSQSDIESTVDVAIQFYLAFTYALALIGPFFFWFLYAAVFHAISVVFGGEGSFSRTMKFVGWGRIPALFAAAVQLAVNVYQYEIRGVSVPTDITAENAMQAAQEIQPPTGVVVVNAVLGIAFTLWAAYIWVYALKHARDLSRREATLTVAVPVLISLLLSIQSLLGAV